MWKINERAGLELPNELTDALKAVNEVTYPNITVLNVLLAAPVTTATVERTIQHWHMLKQISVAR